MSDETSIAIAASKAAARAQGCTCDVWVNFDPQTGTAKVMHDDWCPLLRCMEERTAWETLASRDL